MSVHDDGPPETYRPPTRRTVLSVAGLLGAGGLVAPLGMASTGGALTGGEPVERASPTPADAWRQHGADAANTGHLPNGTGPVRDVHETWRYRNDRVHDGVAVVGDTVYVGGKSLAAVEVATGRERWTYAPSKPSGVGDASGDTPEFGPPAVDDGTAYASVGWGAYDGTVPDDVVVAVDASTGRERWRVAPPAGTGFNAPTAADGTVFVRSTPADGTGATTVHALDGDGTVRWERSVGQRRRGVPTAVASGLVFAPGADGVRALDADSGAVVWTALPDESFERAPVAVVAGGTLYVGRSDASGSSLVALDASTGAERWRRRWRGTYSSLRVGAASGDAVYVQTTAVDADLLTIDATSGEERWRTAIPLGERATPAVDGVALVGGALYLGSTCLEPSDGSVVWSHPLEVTGPGWRLDAVAGGAAYVLGTEVVALRDPNDDPTSTGSATSSTTGDGSATETPTDVTPAGTGIRASSPPTESGGSETPIGGC